MGTAVALVVGLASIWALVEMVDADEPWSGRALVKERIATFALAASLVGLALGMATC